MCWLLQSAQLWYYPTFLLVPLMLLAGVECFAGYRAWRFLLGVNGAVLGFLTGALVGVLLGPMVGLLTALGGAIAGAALFARIVPLGSFVFALGSVASLTAFMALVLRAPAWCIVPLSATAGLAGAIAAVAVCRRFMITIAAIAGAQQLASAWCAYSLPYDSIPVSGEPAASELIAFVALAAAGILLQFITCRGSRGKPRDTRKAQPQLTAD